MSEAHIDIASREALSDELARLRGELKALTERVIELDLLAHHDALVPALNRRGLNRELEKLIARCDRRNETGAMLFVDLDGLKRINDSFGHQAGDAALIHVARFLTAGIRVTDCVARIGGDEFCVLLEATREAEAHETAERLVDSVAAEEFLYDGRPVALSFAIGVTMIERGDTPSAALTRADQDMYRGKAAA